MSEREQPPEPNPYAPPTANTGEVASGPSLARRIFFYALAIALGCWAALTAIGLVGALIALGLKAVGLRLVTAPVWCAVLVAGAVASWRAAGHSASEGRRLQQAHDHDQLLAIYRDRDLAERDRGGDIGSYGDMSAGELHDIYDNIKPDLAPERFEQLLGAIKRRVEAQAEAVDKTDG